jgi:crotonobetainyl-CoA:carnitine CoA-transferase CaiB-like acyl-CoA transferase
MTLPLSGIKVIEVGEYVMVPSATVILADWGADVIKIEHPGRGDRVRAILRTQCGDDEVFDFYFEQNNRSKRSVALDLGKEEARAVLRRMVVDADVFATSMLEPTRQKWGIAFDDLRVLNPRLVYARSSGQGVRGPDAFAPGYDATTYWARSSMGYMANDPDSPQRGMPIGGIGDTVGGLALASGIAAALVGRNASGQGSLVDTSLLGVSAWQMYAAYEFVDVLGVDPRMPTQPAPVSPVGGIYQVAEGRSIALAVSLNESKKWPDFCHVLGHPEWVEQYPDFESRREHSKELVARIREVFLTRTLSEWCEALMAADCACAPYATPAEVISDPQMTANGYLIRHATDPDRFLVSSPAQHDEQPVVARSAAPEVGAHTEEVLLELGYRWDDLDALKSCGAII